MRNPASAGDRAFAMLQRCLPTHALSTLVQLLTRIRLRWVKRATIRVFVRFYGIELDDAISRDPRDYEHFNAFFTRALADGARPQPADPDALSSPVDGRLGQFGDIRADRLIQAKGRDYRVRALLGGDDKLAALFVGGAFATLYLAPHNYHRIHMPVTGTLHETVHVPGRLFGVNPPSVRAIDNLFARNERLAALFDTAAGPMAMVLVGAFGVGSIETVWSGELRGRARRAPWRESDANGITLERGREMGRFNLGSTVILLLGPGAVDWCDILAVGDTVRMGESLGQIIRA